ncbi:MAG: DUF2953 domain-containing protein [Bacillota bacterium]|nr:DUF2953 domain-containing protein [Bacillota bacterium]
MKWLFLIPIILLFLFILISFTKLTIYINYFHHNDDDDLKIELRAWFGLIKYKVKIPTIKVDDDSPSIEVEGEQNNKKKSINQISTDEVQNSIKNYKEILGHVLGMQTIVKKFLKKVSIKQFEWYSVIGVGDAAFTGMITGAIWAVKGSMIGVLSHFLRMKEVPKLIVTPDFNHSIAQTRITCMFQFRIGNAMLAGIKLIRFWKGGRPKLKSNSVFSSEKIKSV